MCKIPNFVSLELLLINYGGYQTENPTVLLLKWLIFKKYLCAALCRDATYIGPLQRSIEVICQNFQPSRGLPNLHFLVLLSGHQSLPHFQQNEPSCTLCIFIQYLQKKFGLAEQNEAMAFPLEEIPLLAFFIKQVQLNVFFHQTKIFSYIWQQYIRF